jgi:ankyrin repeat protein
MTFSAGHQRRDSASSAASNGTNNSVASSRERNGSAAARRNKPKQTVTFDLEGTPHRSDATLNPEEKRFILLVERGDTASVSKTIAAHRDKPHEFDINCTDPLGRSALSIAIINENPEMMNLLLLEGISAKDSLLLAIAEEYVEGVELLLQHEERIREPDQPHSWEAVDHVSASYTPDITPLILAAHMNNYEILKILLDRGAALPTPHNLKCSCDSCLTASREDSLRFSLSRINAYRALASPSLIALTRWVSLFVYA